MDSCPRNDVISLERAVSSGAARTYKRESPTRRPEVIHERRGRYSKVVAVEGSLETRVDEPVRRRLRAPSDDPEAQGAPDV